MVLVTDHVFSSRDYKDFFGLNEENVEEVDNKTLTDLTNRAEKGDTDATTELAAAMALRGQGLEEDESKEEKYFEALTNAAEKLKEEENLSVDKIISMLENHLNLRYRDQED